MAHRAAVVLMCRLHQLCLRATPAAFRQRNGGSLTDTFRDALDDAADRGSPATVVSTGLSECIDLVRQIGALRGRPPATSRAVSTPSADLLLGDLRHATRGLLRGHGLSILVALALGIGATVAVFSVVDTVLLRPLPYPDAERLVRIGGQRPRSAGLNAMSPPVFEALAGRAGSLELISAASSSYVTMTGVNEPRRLLAGWVSRDFFALTGASPHAGRLLAGADHDPAAPPAAVLGFELWRETFGGSADAVGRTIVLDGTVYAVAGVIDGAFVAPEGNRQTGTYDLWLPLERRDLMSEPGLAFLDGLGSLRAGVPFETAAAEIDGLGRALASELELDERVFTTLKISPLDKETVGNAGATLWPLMGAVTLLLLIACSNVSNLLLTRAADREHELSLRIALGAGGKRVAALLLAESLVLAAVGGLAGTAVAYAAVGALRAFSPAEIPRMAELSVDVRALAFALAVSGLVGVVVGTLPAVRTRHADPARRLAAGGRTASTRRGMLRASSALITTQTALALVLLVGAGLLADSFVRLAQVDVGFDPDGLIRMQVNVGNVLEGDDEIQATRVAFFGRLRDRVAALPGVHEVGLTTGAPFSPGGWYSSVSVVGRGEGEPGGPRSGEQAYRHQVSGGYLSILGLELLAGRSIETSDRATSEPVVVINQSMARRYWPDGAALGARVIIGGDGTFTERTVVGIVADARYHELETEGELHIYLPYEQFPAFAMDVVARFDGDPTALAAAMREQVWALRSDLAIRDVSTMRELVYAELVEPGFYTWLLGSFALAALILAALGVYATAARATTLRTREIGTRIALGARPADTVAMVVGGAAAPLALGLALGAAGAWATTRLLAGFLYEVSPTDGTAFAAAAIVLTAIALAAAWIPARRAARVDPMVALRSE